MKRVALGKKMRFEVFKRDLFTCQYCGGKAPEVILHVDHVHPVVDGGLDVISNLVTSCQPCNLGKGARRLDDDSAIQKQRRQLEALEERRQQLELMLEWHKSLLGETDMELDALVEHVTGLLRKRPEHASHNILPDARKALRKVLRKFGLAESLVAADVSFDHYDDACEALGKMGGVAFNRRISANDPQHDDKRIVLAIARKKCFRYFPEHLAKMVVDDAFAAGLPVEFMRRVAALSRNWSDFAECLEDNTKAALAAQQEAAE